MVVGVARTAQKEETRYPGGRPSGRSTRGRCAGALPRWHRHTSRVMLDGR